MEGEVNPSQTVIDISLVLRVRETEDWHKSPLPEGVPSQLPLFLSQACVCGGDGGGGGYQLYFLLP